jgi:hypothetical protein
VPNGYFDLAHLLFTFSAYANGLSPICGIGQKNIFHASRRRARAGISPASPFGLFNYSIFFLKSNHHFLKS